MSFSLVIGGFATSAALGSTNATWAGRIQLILIGAIGAFLLVELIRNSAVFRERRLRKMRPDSIVLRTVGNAPLTRALRRVRELSGSSRLHDTLPMFMTVVASSDGIEFWGRQLVLDSLELLPWSGIESVEPTYINETFGSGKGLVVSARIAGEAVAVPFYVYSMGLKTAIPGLTFLSKRELAVVIDKFYEWAAMDEQTSDQIPTE
ncbi:hypothetical protein [Agreia bicolorata]|uniref:hypothetical protein n=1 Tax=Agreia bicolorata TaxID=110935 RepID=UPI001115E06D|nr:hypothetical protein [Agreia bicolorata]